jgi:hypothetical protein
LEVLMKNLNGLQICAALLMTTLVLTGCPTDGSSSENGEATLSSISVAGVTVTPVPTAVPKSVWEGEEFELFDLGADQLGSVVINDTALLNSAKINVAASSGAKVKYAAAELEVPSSFQDSSTITLSNNGYLCIQVTSEDGKAVNYYVVEVKLANTITSLTQVTVGGITAVLGTQNADWDQAGTGTIGLSNVTKTNAVVAVTKANANQTVKYAKVTGTGAPSFGDTATFSFADGDFLYIEVTAENGINKGVYKLEVQVGRDTTLSVITIGGTSVTSTSLGTPAATLTDAVAGAVLFSTLQDVGGFAVSVTPTDTEASVQWAAVSTDSNDATFATTSPIVFTDGGFLYVKVTAANTTTIAYYKVRVNLMQSATIKYGQPVIKASSEKFVDSAWGDVTETYTIAKVFSSDSSADYTANPNTSGVAKALFDESGLYVYVEVTDPDVSSGGSGNHEKDSVELFINEGVEADGNLIKTGGYADKGGQYRVGADGAISGDPAAASAAMNPSKVSAWTTETGYVVIFQAPWRFTEQYPLEDEKKIGFELQINACSGNGRDGVMVWNNIAHTNYQNVSDYGEASLDLEGHTLAVNARNPVISAHPASKAYTPPLPNAAESLTVTATVPDSGTLTYQWYSNAANSYTGGTAISTQTGTSYTPPLTEGTTYYWVVVTNTITDNSDGGNKTAVMSSNIASIVVSSVPLVEKIVAGSCGVPVYRFTLPSGKTWSDYKEMTYTVLINDEETLGFTGTQIRSHIVGNYALADFGSSGEINKQADWGPDRLLIIANNVAISNIVGDGYETGTWKELTYDITTPDGAANKVPAATAIGPFYLGIGFAVNDSNAANQAATYYVKDVALVGTDNSKLAADPLDTVDGALTLGQLKVKFQTGPGVTRTLEAEPSSAE